MDGEEAHKRRVEAENRLWILVVSKLLALALSWNASLLTTCHLVPKSDRGQVRRRRARDLQRHGPLTVALSHHPVFVGVAPEVQDFPDPIAQSDVQIGKSWACRIQDRRRPFGRLLIVNNEAERDVRVDHFRCGFGGPPVDAGCRPKYLERTRSLRSGFPRVELSEVQEDVRFLDKAASDIGYGEGQNLDRRHVAQGLGEFVTEGAAAGLRAPLSMWM